MLPSPPEGTNYLQSELLKPPIESQQAQVDSTILKNATGHLKSLGVPLPPIATKRSCELFNDTRRDAICLELLRKAAIQKEAAVAYARQTYSSKFGRNFTSSRTKTASLASASSSQRNRPLSLDGAMYIPSLQLLIKFPPGYIQTHILGEESTLNYEGFGHTVVTPEMAGWLSNEFTTEADFHNLPKETRILN